MSDNTDWTCWEGSQAQAHIRAYDAEEDAEKFDWADGHLEPDVWVYGTDDHNLHRYEWPDGSAAVAGPNHWEPGVHRELLSAAALRLTGKPEPLALYVMESECAASPSGQDDDAHIHLAQASADRIPPPRDEDARGTPQGGW